MIRLCFYDYDEQVGETALMSADNNGHHECVSILVANGADVNIASKVIEASVKVKHRSI